MTLAPSGSVPGRTERLQAINLPAGMLDRLTFWWHALRRGVRYLNTAAGWLGSTVLMLGAAAGITVPLVFHISLWLTAVVLMALFRAVILEGSMANGAALDYPGMTSPSISISVIRPSPHSWAMTKPLSEWRVSKHCQTG